MARGSSSRETKQHLRFVLTVSAILSVVLWVVPVSSAQQDNTRIVSGTVVNEKSEVVGGATVSAQSEHALRTATTNSQGKFSLRMPEEAITLTVSGPSIAILQQTLAAGAPSSNLRLRIHYVIAKAQETIVITAKAADPSIDRRNDSVYQNTLFNRDDQLIETLDSGINAGQHEGGGKSLEVRRYGFNLDHGGANGGLKILVDDIPQNQGTQGHGQGYLGSLKSITPELVEDVDIINGPFNAEYGDFSALGVIHIRQKERMGNVWTLRAQGGSFGAYRTFAAWSPRLESIDSFVAWEHAYTDGPFKNPLHYVRDNFTSNFTFKLDSTQSLGFRFNGGRNNFDSSGQIPLDQVLLGKLDRFGYVDPSDGGNVRSGGGSVYYKKDFSTNSTLRVDGYVTRSLFDLFSNFTFYLNDPVHGDGIQQHDSRLQDGISAQHTHAGTIFGRPSLLVAGANLFDSWINVDLFHQQDRKIFANWTLNNVHIVNEAFYAQQGIELPHLHVDAGLRFDVLRFNVADKITPTNDRVTSSGFVEPKVNLVYTPSTHFPASLHFNFGRAVTSLDARSIALDHSAAIASATNFYMLGTSHNLKRFSASTDLFLVDRQHEAVYSADDGTIDYQGPSRSYGWEVKTSYPLTDHLSWNDGITQVSNAFFLGSNPREYVDAAPHTVANSGLTLEAWHGIFASVRYRHVSGYEVFNPDSTAPPAPPYTDPFRAHASGLDVVDFSMTTRLRHGIEWNVSVDNLNNKRYYETQNLIDSRIAPTADAEARVHGTPGYPIGFTTGITYRFE